MNVTKTGSMTREERATLDEQRRSIDGQGGQIRSHVPSKAYRDGWDRIFGRKKDRERDAA